MNAIVACRGSSPTAVTLDGTRLDIGESDWSGTGQFRLLRIRQALTGSASARIEVRQGTIVVGVTLPPMATPMRRQPSRAGLLSVVVPIFGGREATRACLVALAAQTSRRPIEVVLIDDACPEPEMTREVACFAAAHGWLLLRNDVNRGFAASVNAAAAVTRGEHLLLLNADAILPSGALDRLLTAAADEGVGTVVPFSNDGGFTSFPDPRRPNGVPDDLEAGRIDAAAWGVGHRRPIDIPAGTAFCMLVSGACWDALGGLDLGYGRGYFEDVDLCLRAKRIGYRNVLAPDVFVRHLGGRSFGAAKRALVAENARLLVERFPDYDLDWPAFVEADPLMAIRADIEGRVWPTGPIRLVVGQGAWAVLAAERDAPDHARRGDRVLILSEGVDGVRTLRAGDGGMPQALSFRPDETAGLGRYLGRLDIRAVTFADPSERLLRDAAQLFADTIPRSVVLVGRRSSRLLDANPDLFGDASVRALDGMGRADLGFAVEALLAPTPRRGMPPRVAALAPRPTLAGQRLASSLHRRLCPFGGEVVIFGEGIGRSDRPRTTGRMDGAEYAAALLHRDITHVLLPDADAPFALIEALRATSPLPAAYVDWSKSRHRAAAGDLALRGHDDDASRIGAILSWCLGPRAAGKRVA